ncbi:MAG: hypothetical protein GXY83_09100 [Rhodopirellula sp.]|nr:hypothetical protein [Rhodopirellula sp.]
MGLRFLSIGSVVADTVSLATLALGGVSSEGAIGGLIVAGATIFPFACIAARLVTRQLDTVTPEVAWQLAGFDANF